MRDQLARRLRGRGIELGPGHQPMGLPNSATVQYVDRWTPDQNRALYPELPTDAYFPIPDFVADFDVERLTAFGSRSQDFVVCSHVLEHLADPIGFMVELHRVLKRGGTLLLLLPDRHCTFDRHRDPTSLEHLVKEHDGGVTVVDDDHVRDFLERSDVEAAYLDLPEDPAEHPKFFDWHRARSIHVHCWEESEFDEVLDYCSTTLGQRWKRLDAIHSADTGMEFGYLLQKPRLSF